MKWFLKAMAFQAFSRLPGGTALYRLAQRFTGSHEQTTGRLQGKAAIAFLYWDWLEKNTPPGWLAEAAHLDFGSGWLPPIPVVFHALGVRTQYLVDIQPHLTVRGVAETVRVFRELAPTFGRTFSRLPEPVPESATLEQALAALGMTYAAPYDELAGQIQGRIGFATATQMLLHLDPATLRHCLDLLHRVLPSGGSLLGVVHLRQLFDGLNSRSSPYYALQYSAWFWEKIVNSAVMSYNRLKAPDYRAALETAGFEILHFDVERGTEADYAALDRARLHPDFARYTRDDLAARHLFFVARKP